MLICCVLFILASCNKKVKKGEELSAVEYRQSTGILSENDSVNQFASSANSVLLTGIDRFRLIPVYKINPETDRNVDVYNGTSYNDYYGNDGSYKYFMPGLDIIYGYNMINMGHYDIETGKLSYFFERPVLIRTLYFPGVKNDSLNHQPVSREYFLVSVYDEDTNRDLLINTKDLRKIYHIDQFNSTKTQIIPPDYSAIRSTYDHRNDIMYIYARYDANKNGTPEKKEPVVIFWIRLNDPTITKRMN